MKIKKLLLIFTILFTSIQVYSQGQNEFRVYYGTSDSKLTRNQGLDGSASYETENFNEFGIKYLRQIFIGLHVESGINYLSTEVKINSAPTVLPTESRYEKLEIISIPIYANFTFLKYLFVNGGPIVDFQTSENSNQCFTPAKKQCPLWRGFSQSFLRW